MADPTSKHRLALFPASFDPITNGHLDLIERCRALFDQTVIAVARNVSKSATFNADERMEILQSVTAGMEDVSVQVFDGLVVHHADRRFRVRVRNGPHEQPSGSERRDSLLHDEPGIYVRQLLAAQGIGPIRGQRGRIRPCHRGGGPQAKAGLARLN